MKLIPCFMMTRRRPFQGRGRGRRGFTLIELLTVITMVGIMATIALPYFRVSPARRVRADARDIIRNLEVARTRALASKKNIRISFDVGEGDYTAYLDYDGDGSYNEDARESQESGVTPRTLGPSVQFGRGSAPALPQYPGTGAVTFTDDRVEFNNRGMTLPFGIRGAIYLTYVSDPTAVAAISISGSASLKIWEYRGGAWQ